MSPQLKNASAFLVPFFGIALFTTPAAAVGFVDCMIAMVPPISYNVAYDICSARADDLSIVCPDEGCSGGIGPLVSALGPDTVREALSASRRELEARRRTGCHGGLSLEREVLACAAPSCSRSEDLCPAAFERCYALSMSMCVDNPCGDGTYLDDRGMCRPALGPHVTVDESGRIVPVVTSSPGAHYDPDAGMCRIGRPRVHRVCTRRPVDHRRCR